jgi:hypothetical protein
MNTPAQLRDDEVRDSAVLAKWLAQLVAFLRASFADRPRMTTLTVGPVTGASGSVTLMAPPFRVAGVALMSVQQLDGALSLSVAPCASFVRQQDGRVVVSWQFLPATGKFQLVLLLVEG